MPVKSWSGKIRLATPADLVELNSMIMRSKQSNGYDDAFMDACREELAVTPEKLQACEFWLADDQVICGCACLMFTERARVGDVHAFFVEPEYKRCGVGRVLMEQLVTRANSLDLKFLRLDSDPAAVTFYQAMGFVITGEVPSGSIPGRTLPTMTREL